MRRFLHTYMMVMTWLMGLTAIWLVACMVSGCGQQTKPVARLTAAPPVRSAELDYEYHITFKYKSTVDTNWYEVTYPYGSDTRWTSEDITATIATVFSAFKPSHQIQVVQVEETVLTSFVRTDYQLPQ